PPPLSRGWASAGAVPAAKATKPAAITNAHRRPFEKRNEIRFTSAAAPRLFFITLLIRSTTEQTDSRLIIEISDSDTMAKIPFWSLNKGEFQLPWTNLLKVFGLAGKLQNAPVSSRLN